MIDNLDTSGVKEKIQAETSGNEAVKAIYDHIEKAQGSYEIDPKASGLEFTSTTRIKGYPNRAKMKIWQPEENKLLAWFYKRSAVAWSKDRYSLGGVVWELDKVKLGEVGSQIDEFLVWLDSGLDPDKRPSNWISAFPYDIPE